MGWTEAAPQGHHHIPTAARCWKAERPSSALGRHVGLFRPAHACSHRLRDGAPRIMSLLLPTAVCFAAAHQNRHVLNSSRRPLAGNPVG